MNILPNINQLIDDLNNKIYSEKEIENKLITVCLGLYRYDYEERITFLNFLDRYITSCDGKKAYSYISNLRNTYFLKMEDVEKCKYIDIILRVQDKDNTYLWGNIFELVAGLFVICPISREKDLINLIYNNIDANLEYPSVICSFCYSVENIFNGLGISEREKIISKIRNIKNINNHNFIDETIETSLKKISKGVGLNENFYGNT